MKKVILIFSLILMVVSCNAGNITGGGNGNEIEEGGNGNGDQKPGSKPMTPVNPDSVIKYDFHEITLANIKDDNKVKVRKKVNGTIYGPGADWTYDQEKLDKLWKENINVLTLKDHKNNAYLEIDSNTDELKKDGKVYKKFIKAVIVEDHNNTHDIYYIGAIYYSEQKMHGEDIDEENKYELWTPFEEDFKTYIYRRKLIYDKVISEQGSLIGIIEHNKKEVNDPQFVFDNKKFIKNKPFNKYNFKSDNQFYFLRYNNGDIHYSGKGFFN